jgi:uncharacterized membrane-anchored protein
MADNYEKKRATIIDVKIVYKTSSGNAIIEQYLLDFSIFDGLRCLGAPPLHAISSSLDKIEKNIGNLSSRFNRLKGNTYTKPDIDAENKKLLEGVERFEAEADVRAATDVKP